MGHGSNSYCSYSLGGFCFPAVIPKPSVNLFSVFWPGLHCELLMGACQWEQAFVVSRCWQWSSVSDSQGKAQLATPMVGEYFSSIALGQAPFLRALLNSEAPPITGNGVKWCQHSGEKPELGQTDLV